MPSFDSFLRRAAVISVGLVGLHLVSSAEAATADPTAKPDMSRFTSVVLAQGSLDEPMVFEVLKDGRVYIAERKGAFKVYDPKIPGVKTMGVLSVNTRGNNEQGLAGMTVDPKFAQNGFVYLYYFHPTIAKAVISRWEVRNDVLVANSEKVMLEWPAQRETCCHTGGGMTWDGDGNLYITIGNNTGNALSAHTDERPGRSSWDDQRGAANTDSFEGKILRIHPEPDGTYSIPKGNLFPPGTAKTRPEIYTMGHRNAWRVSVDSKSRYVYWGEVGPDAQNDTEIGPRGYDELNQARGPGFFGWPYFVGESAFPHFDYATKKPGAKKDPLKPINDSPNNTGLRELPPVSPSFIYYPYAVSEKFPEVGSGGRSATGGPIYHRSDFKEPKRPWPDYFEGKWIATDLSRRWIMVISMKENGDYKSMERFMPGYRPVEPIDMKFGPDGDLYVLEYGGRWFQASPEAKLVRIEYEGGNRKPVVSIASNKAGGVPPFNVKLSSEGTVDPDGDKLTYRWEIFEAGRDARVFNTPNPDVRLEGVGSVVARLTVTDPAGASDSKSVGIISGNEPPRVSLKLTGNSTFFFPNQSLPYSVDVADTEDGTLASGKIPADRVSVSFDYAAQGFDVAKLKDLARGDAAAARFPVAQALIAQGNCKACHLVDGKLVGPSFTQIAAKYKDDPTAPEKLAKKIITGGNGSWGEVSMPPNATIAENDAATILKYVLTLGEKAGQPLPLSGSFSPQLPSGDAGRGSFIVRAVYTDQGGDGVPPLTGETIQVLRSPTLAANKPDVSKDVESTDRNATAKVGGHLGFTDLDLTGIKQLEIAASANRRDNQVGGEIEIRLDSPTGEILGTTKIESPELRGPATGGVVDGKAPPTAGGRGARPGASVKVDLKETTGRHAVYFVFKNEAAKPGDRLLSLTTVKFNNQKL